MNTKIMKSLAASVIAAASFCAFATDPIDVQVPGSDQSSEPCTPKQRTDDYHKNHYKEDIESPNRTMSKSWPWLFSMSSL